MKINAIRFNTETKKYEIGNLTKRGKFTVVETGDDSFQLERKYGRKTYFYDGKYCHLN